MGELLAPIQLESTLHATVSEGETSSVSANTLAWAPPCREKAVQKPTARGLARGTPVLAAAAAFHVSPGEPPISCLPRRRTSQEYLGAERTSWAASSAAWGLQMRAVAIGDSEHPVASLLN